MKKQQKFHSGTSGLVLPVPKRLLPPEFQQKERIHYYASVFNSIEINSSFYKMPRVSTIIKWCDAVPDDFQFTFKLSKTITHSKGLVFNTDDIHDFMKTIDQVKDKKGCLLIQFPPSFTIAGIDPFKKLLTHIRDADEGEQWKTVVEFRNQSWYQQETYDTLLHHNAAMVLHDHPSSTTPIVNSSIAFVYLRFHGTEGGYRGSYGDDFLQEHALKIQDWLAEGKSVYVYFNNTMGDAAKNLITLNEMIER